MTCNRCGKDIEPGEIHLSRGGEDRRLVVEKILKQKLHNVQILLYHNTGNKLDEWNQTWY